jgi:hypothetical protein
MNSSKNYIKAILIILFTSLNFSLFAQVQAVCNADSVPLKRKPEPATPTIKRINKGEKMTVIQQTTGLTSSRSRFFKVIYNLDTAYISEVFISPKTNPTNRVKLFEALNKLPFEATQSQTVASPVKVYTDSSIQGAIKLYGPEDKRDEYTSGDYDSITLTWYCVNGSYRSITYVFKDGEYKKQTGYRSDCIKR